MKRLALAALAAVLVTPAHAVVWTPGGWRTPPCCQGYPPFRVQPFAGIVLGTIGALLGRPLYAPAGVFLPVAPPAYPYVPPAALVPSGAYRPPVVALPPPGYVAPPPARRYVPPRQAYAPPPRRDERSSPEQQQPPVSPEMADLARQAEQQFCAEHPDKRFCALRDQYLQGSAR
jgi:hypothetical protein